MTRSRTRREVLLGAAALAGTAALPRSASAQAKGRIVVGTWGGDYARLLNKNIEAPILIKDGWEVVQDQAGDPERRSKMFAEVRLPRGTTDVQGLSALNMAQMNEAGTVLPIDYGKLKNAGNLLPAMKYPHGVGHIYSGKVGVHNPKVIATAPTSYKEVFDPKHGNKLGIIDIQYQFTMMAAALASGGSMTNYEPGKERLMACRKAGAKILPTNEAMAQALQNEEVGICIMWKARAVQWQKAGAKVDTVAPKEGIPLYISGFVIPKNAQNKDAAHFWLNEMLQPSAQEAFAEDMGYNGSVTNAKIPAETEKRIGFTAEERKRLIDLDYGYLAKNDSALKEWWDKSFKG